MMIGSYVVPGFVLHMPGFDGKVSATVEAPSDDLSGNTDSTDRADKGVKPKKLNVSFSLQYQHKKKLTELTELAEARESGEAVKYQVVHGLATILRIRQAQFAGSVNIEQDDTLRCWHISFALAEHRSVPEAAAKRTHSGEAPKESHDELVARMEAA